MPQAYAIHNTMTTEHSDDIIAELQGGIGVLLHLGAASHPSMIHPEEINFVCQRVACGAEAPAMRVGSIYLAEIPLSPSWGGHRRPMRCAGFALLGATETRRNRPDLAMPCTRTTAATSRHHRAPCILSSAACRRSTRFKCSAFGVSVLHIEAMCHHRCMRARRETRQGASHHGCRAEHSRAVGRG